MEALTNLRTFLTMIGVLAHLLVLSQAVVRGKITDQSGETLIGATVVVKGSPGTGTVSDLDGNYNLALPGIGPITLIYSFVGFDAQDVAFDVKAGEVVVHDIILGEKAIELTGVEIEGKARRSGDGYLDRMKANAPAALDFISRDVMLKTGDSDAASAVKRISGVSTVGAFVTVRGLADRYLVTAINGGRVPTLDPFTNNMRLDLFPTGLMDNIVITKTLTPDLPGDWAGAYMSLNTSDYPSRLQVSISATVGYNANSTYKDVVIGNEGTKDLLGRDDGTRAIPSLVPDEVEDYPQFIDPNIYQQFEVLGLGGYLNGLGITSNTPGFSSTGLTSGPVLPRLALTQLGLLAPASLYEVNAVESAVSAYNSSYDLSYFSPILNADLARLNTQWDNTKWRVGTTTGSPNMNAAVSIGNQLTLFKESKQPKQLGFLVGMRYATETQNDANSVILRTIERFDDTEPGDEFNRKGDQHVSIISSGWNALGNVSLKWNRNNTFSLLAMGNVLGENNARYLVFKDPTVNDATFVSEEQFWEQRKLWLFQYSSKHLIPAFNLIMDLDASYSDGQRDVLDLKVVQYIKPPDGQPIDDVDGALRPPGRIFRYLNETLLDTRANFELPLSDRPDRVRKFKFGGSYRYNERNNDQKYYVVQGAPGPTQWTEPDRFLMREDGRFTSLYVPFGSFKDNDIGILKVGSGYLMLDHAFTERIRFAGGVRAEWTDLVSDIRRYYETGIAATDPTRGTVGDLSIGGASGAEPKPAVPGTIKQVDILPSANLIWKLSSPEKNPTTLRLSYFRSLSRPSFREFSVVQYYDYLLQAPVYGNPELEMTTVDNGDVRLERSFKNGDNVSVSGFYKYFRNHIELLQTAQGGFTWRNAERSEVIGMEIEGRAKLIRNVEWRGNLTLMYSQSQLRTVLDGSDVEYSTPMFGQAPYIVNSTLSYGLDSLRMNLSVSYNVQGPKLAVSNAELDPDGIRAYEMPRHLVDITLNKRFGEHWAVNFRIRDLLNSPIRRTYLFSKGYVGDFDRFRFGTQYLLTLTYSIR